MVSYLRELTFELVQVRIRVKNPIGKPFHRLLVHHCVTFKFQVAPQNLKVLLQKITRKFGVII